jgi:chemotaxis protein methyltransferase CheR
MRTWARDWVSGLCAERAGLAMTDAAIAAMETRLAPLARREGFGSVDELLARARERDDLRLTWRIVEAVASAEGGFFRDPAAIDHLCRAVLPAMARPGQPLRIWIAGCGAGQEAYSLAMALAERQPRIATDILATDLSAARLQKAQAGAYSAYEVQRGLSAHRLVRWFEPHAGEFLVSAQLRGLVRWGRFNPMDDAGHLGRFDVILCRGVLPCLNDQARARFTATLAGALTPEGRLMLGLGEAPARGDWASVDGAPGLFAPRAVVRLAA